MDVGNKLYSILFYSVQRIHRRNIGHGPPDRPFPPPGGLTGRDVFSFMTDPTGATSRSNSSNSLLRDCSDITFRRALTAFSTLRMRSSLSAELCLTLRGDLFHAGITFPTLYCSRLELPVGGGGMSNVG